MNVYNIIRQSMVGRNINVRREMKSEGVKKKDLKKNRKKEKLEEKKGLSAIKKLYQLFG